MTTFKALILFGATIATITLTSCVTSRPISSSQHLTNVASASGVGLDGYDPVAFFTDKKPVNGDPAITAKHEDATYFFASEEHKEMFESDPEKYSPQFGGFCAYGASVDALFPVDVSTWQVRDEKLYLNLNHDILKAFNSDIEGNIAKAEKNWPGLVEKYAEEPAG